MSVPVIDLAEATAGNSAFSRQLPGLQLAIDSTSLGEAKLCARRYYYSIILGYQPKFTSADLTFGLLLHSAREHYEHGLVATANHDEALRRAVHWVLKSTWVKDLNRPWISSHPVKTRDTLLRTVVWYLDQFREGDPLRTIILANGKPAVELSFRFESGFQSKITGEEFLLCGHMDRLAELNDEIFIPDIKTTKHMIDASWFMQWTPDNQFSLYTSAGKVVYHVPAKGVIVDGVQVGVTFSRFQRGVVQRTEPSLAEWHQDTGRWLAKMERCAEEGAELEARGQDPVSAWDMNDKACNIWASKDNPGGCPYRAICSRPPGARAQWLASDYRRRVWDPLQRRGDI